MRQVCHWLGTFGVLLMVGCTYANGPVPAPLVFAQRGPVCAGPAMANDKAGVATAYGILFLGFGDASIEAAMKENDLTDIHHVDCETMNILYLFARYQTIVYGR